MSKNKSNTLHIGNIAVTRYLGDDTIYITENDEYTVSISVDKMPLLTQALIAVANNYVVDTLIK